MDARYLPGKVNYPVKIFADFDQIILQQNQNYIQ